MRPGTPALLPFAAMPDPASLNGIDILLDGTFVRVAPEEHPLPLSSEVAVNFQDYHVSSVKRSRFGKIVGIDEESEEYLVMLGMEECVGTPMRRVEWREQGT